MMQKQFYYSSSVEDMGDLSVFHGFEDFDLNGYELFHGKTYPKEFGSLNEIEKLNFPKLYQEGYTSVILKSKNKGKPFTDLPINIKLKSERVSNSNQKLLGTKPNFVIKKDGLVHYVVVNGFMIGVKSPFGKVSNALIQ